MAKLKWIPIVVTIVISHLVLGQVSMAQRQRRDGLRGAQMEESAGSSVVEATEDQATDSGFSMWSEWSQCNRRCGQFRTRMCLDSTKCDTRTQKHVQACESANCRRKLLMMTPYRERGSGSESSSSENSGSDSEFHVLFHMQQYIYTEWSEWSPCSSLCYTKRRKTCRLNTICGRNIVEEDAMCYRDDGADSCRHLYWERRKNMENYTRKRYPGKVHPLDVHKCGVSEVDGSGGFISSSFFRIIGGRKSLKDAWPWQVLILNKYRQAFCGGILLSDTWVLTAAHCVRRRLYIRAGEYDLSTGEGSEQEERIINSFVYPDYDAETVDNDVALLKMRFPLILNRHVQPVCLPTEDDELPLFARATILGWGKRRNEAKYGTETLHQAEVPIVPPQSCKSAYNDQYISDNMLCAGYTLGKVDSCAGDSGGPLLYRRPKGAWTVYGVTSFGDGCGRKGKYGIYANIPNFVTWIRGIVRELG